MKVVLIKEFPQYPTSLLNRFSMGRTNIRRRHLSTEIQRKESLRSKRKKQESNQHKKRPNPRMTKFLEPLQKLTVVLKSQLCKFLNFKALRLHFQCRIQYNIVNHPDREKVL